MSSLPRLLSSKNWDAKTKWLIDHTDHCIFAQYNTPIRYIGLLHFLCRILFCCKIATDSKLADTKSHANRRYVCKHICTINYSFPTCTLHCFSGNFFCKSLLDRHLANIQNRGIAKHDTHEHVCSIHYNSSMSP